jgi:uridine kinase
MSDVVPLVVIGIQGGSCAGKTTLADAVRGASHRRVTTIEIDSFFYTADRLATADPLAMNFDDPVSIDWDLLRGALQTLRSGASASIPSYDYVSGKRGPLACACPTPVLIIEGLWAFCDPEVYSALDLRIFIDVPPDIRLSRRIRRDVLGPRPRGWAIGGLLDYYERYSRPMHATFVEPGRHLADIVVNGELGFSRAVVDEIVSTVEDVADRKGVRKNV